MIVRRELRILWSLDDRSCCNQSDNLYSTQCRRDMQNISGNSCRLYLQICGRTPISCEETLAAQLDMKKWNSWYLVAFRPIEKLFSVQTISDAIFKEGTDRVAEAQCWYIIRKAIFILGPYNSYSSLRYRAICDDSCSRHESGATTSCTEIITCSDQNLVVWR